MYNKIKELCKEKSISVNALEKELGFAKGSLCKIDKNKPSSEKLQKIADYFGVQLDYLTGTSEYKTKKEMFQHFDAVADISALKLIEKTFGKDGIKVLQMFYKMNVTGKQKILEDMSDMTELPKYIDNCKSSR